MNPKPDKEANSTAIRGQVSDEDIVFNAVLKSHPILERFVDSFDLCSVHTGDRFLKTEQRVTAKFRRKDRTNGDYTMSMILAYQILSTEEVYTKDDIINLIIKETKVSKKEAARKFKLMDDTGVLIGGSLGELYSFRASTPF
jgi:hypothetical protein